MQIMLIDNSEKELGLLRNALSSGYSRFKRVYSEGVGLPDYIEIKEKLLNNYDERDIERCADEIVLSAGDVPTYFVVDLFLTDAEHEKSYECNDTVDSHSGSKLAKRIIEKVGIKCRVSLMSKQFPGADKQSAMFGRLIEKPIYKGSSALNPLLMETELLANDNMCSDYYGLPKYLNTIRVMDAFQNIIFFNAVTM